MLGVETHLARAQAQVEYGAAAGGASAAAGAAAVGKSVTGALGKLNQTLAGAAKTGDAAKPAPAKPVVTAAAPGVAKPAAAAEPAPPADFSALAIGMDRADMLKKVGKPYMTISSMESSALVENCTYRKGSDTVAVTLRGGKVTAITGADELVAK